MSLLFWRKTKDIDGNPRAQEVNETNPLPVQLIHPDENDIPPVRIEQTYLPPVAGQSFTRLIKVPGIGTGAAYAAGEAFGTAITLSNIFRPEQRTGTVVKVVFIDKDDEGIQKDAIFFDSLITTTADNDAYAPSDADILSCQGGVSIATFFNWANNQVGVWTGSHWVESLDTNLYLRLVTQGADNIAAGSEPYLTVTVVPD